MKGEAAAEGRIQNQGGCVHVRHSDSILRVRSKVGSELGEILERCHAVSRSYDLKVEKWEVAGMEKRKEGIWGTMPTFPTLLDSEAQRADLVCCSYQS